MSGQGDAAAERSAHVSRGEGGAWGPSLIVERDGAALLRVTAERNAARAEAARLREAVTLGADALDALLDGGAILSGESARITQDFVGRMRAALAKENSANG